MASGHPKKVIFLSPGQTEIGGCATRSRLISEGLAERGWHVLAICRAATSRRPRLLRGPTLTVLEVPGFGIRIAVVIYIILGGALGIMLGRRALFLAMQLGSQTLVGGFCAAVLRRPFVVLSTTGGEISEVDEALNSRFRFMHRRNLRRADYLVGQTSQAAQELAAFAPQNRIAVIHNPIPTVEGVELDGQPRALFTGRLTREKDLPVLLDAWKLVTAQISAAHLTLVGAGGVHRSVEDELRRVVNRNRDLRETVTFTGWVDDVGVYLRNADVYVFPSRSEGMSNSLLEACAWERIVVASDIVPNRAVLGDDYPFLFPTGDRQALADTLITAFGDANGRAAAASAIKHRKSVLSRGSAITRYEEVLLAAKGLRSKPTG